MADCSCDFCAHDNQCPYAYNESDCCVDAIKEARVIVDEDFKEFLRKLEEKNEDLLNNHVDVLISTMKTIIHESEQILPDWAVEGLAIV